MILGGLFLKKMNAMFHIIILYELSDQYLCLCDMATVDRYPLDVQYCGVCGMPPEYCDFSGETAKCHEWMKTNLPSYYSRLVEKGWSEKVL